MKRFVYLLFIFFYLIALVPMAFASDGRKLPEDVKPLISKVIAAYGGEKVVEGITGIHASGDINALMRQDRGSYEFSFKRPRKLRVETKYRRSFETRILSDAIGYRGTDESPLAEVKGQRFLAMVYQYKHVDILYGLLHGSYSINRKEKETLNGRIVEVLHLTDQEGPSMDVYVDVETFYVVKVTGYFVMGVGQATALSSEFSDFRKVSDTVFPFKVTNYAGGQKIAETIMKTYTVNPKIPDASFAP